MAKVTYQEGAIIAVPLRNGQFCRGVIARCNGRGKMFCYFFEGVFSSPNAGSDNSHLLSSEAILSAMCGDLGLMNGDWSVIGKIEPWMREDWPLPSFTCEDDDPSLITVTQYDEDTLAVETIQKVSREDLHGEWMLEDEVFGAGYTEIILTRKLVPEDLEENEQA